MSNPFEPLPLDEQWSPERAISEEDWRMAVDAFQATDDEFDMVTTQSNYIGSGAL